MPRRASCAARIVPDAPPPTIATWKRSDFVFRPMLRVCRAGPAPHHMIVHGGYCSSGGLPEKPWNDGMHEAGESGREEPYGDGGGAHAVRCPAHPEGARVFPKQ